MTAVTDRRDPAVRADADLARFERAWRTRRVLGALALAAATITLPAAAGPITGSPGATVGAIVLAVLCVGAAAVVRPWTWSAGEREHHRLAAIWAQARADDGETTPWPRYAAWARAEDGRVELLLVTHAGTDGPASPSPFSATVVRTLDADLMVEAASAMESLREDAAQREARAYERHVAAAAAAERRRDDDAVRRVDDAATAHERRAEEQMRRELGAEQAVERRAQAEAVARALRQP